MTLVLIGPLCEDLIIIGDEESSKVGGASYFQSFVYEEFYDDYLAIVNASNPDLIDAFPDRSKVRLLLKDDTHHFINEYPNKDDLDIRRQSTNFADIPILKDDLKAIFEGDDMDVDAFVLNPLNSNDFPQETIEYLSGFNVPVFISLQGFLRFKGEGNSLVLGYDEKLDSVISFSDVLFMDEDEFTVISGSDFHDFELVITNGSKGSRILFNSEGKEEEICIDAVKCEVIIDSTGCGDTYMASYISHRLKGKSIRESADFASLISSLKLKTSGPYRK